MLNYIRKIVIAADPKNDYPSSTGAACPATSTLNGASGGEKLLINTIPITVEVKTKQLKADFISIIIFNLFNFTVIITNSP